MSKASEGNTRRCARWRAKNKKKYRDYMREYMAKRRAAKVVPD